MAPKNQALERHCFMRYIINFSEKLSRPNFFFRQFIFQSIFLHVSNFTDPKKVANLTGL